MKLVMNIKPSTITARTVNEVKNKATRSCTSTWGVSSYVSGCSSETHVYAYNIEKHNTRRKRTKTGWKVTKSGFAKAHIYHIDIKVLKAMGLKVVQGRRTFKIVKACGGKL